MNEEYRTFLMSRIDRFTAEIEKLQKQIDTKQHEIDELYTLFADELGEKPDEKEQRRD